MNLVKKLNKLVGVCETAAQVCDCKVEIYLEEAERKRAKLLQVQQQTEKAIAKLDKKIAALQTEAATDRNVAAKIKDLIEQPVVTQD